MEAKSIWDNQDIVTTLQNGGVVVMPTDTIYGIVGRAEDEGLVSRIYKIRNRDLHKPCIILISDATQLEKFSINLSTEQKSKLAEYWPGPVSLIFDCTDEKFSYLHRGTRSLAFRVPSQEGLRALISETGPLIAPSANTEKFPPSENIEQAKSYFNNYVDLYVDGGFITGKASKVIRIQPDGVITIIRE